LKRHPSDKKIKWRRPTNLFELEEDDEHKKEKPDLISK